MRQTNLENEIRQKYAGLTYEELVEAAQRENLSDLAFIMAQPGLSSEFEEYMADMGIEEYDERWRPISCYRGTTPPWISWMTRAFTY